MVEGAQGSGIEAGEARVEADRPCASCGYNLRGLRVEGTCPECGTSVALSLRGRLLRYASPAYLAVLHRGAALAELAVLLTLLGVVAFIVVQLAVDLSQVGATPGALAGAVTVLTAGTTLVVSVIGLWGWWLISTPDPGSPPDAPGARARRVLRVGVVVQAVAALALFIFDSVKTAIAPTAAGAVAVSMASNGLDVLSMGAWLVSFFAAMAYIRTLAARVPDAILEGSARAVAKLGAWAAGGVALIVAPLWMVGLLAGGPAPLAAATGILACVLMPLTGTVALIAFIRYIILLDDLRRKLKRSRAAAELERAAVGPSVPPSGGAPDAPAAAS